MSGFSARQCRVIIKAHKLHRRNGLHQLARHIPHKFPVARVRQRHVALGFQGQEARFLHLAAAHHHDGAQAAVHFGALLQLVEDVPRAGFLCREDLKPLARLQRPQKGISHFKGNIVAHGAGLEGFRLRVGARFRHPRRRCQSVEDRLGHGHGIFPCRQRAVEGRPLRTLVAERAVKGNGGEIAGARRAHRPVGGFGLQHFSLQLRMGPDGDLHRFINGDGMGRRRQRRKGGEGGQQARAAGACLGKFGNKPGGCGKAAAHFCLVRLSLISGHSNVNRRLIQ